MTDLISYDDFAKLDIRIGEIKSAEVIEGADKLFRLMVDVGDPELRQIVSGIRGFFAGPEELVGKKCTFLTNLEPRVIRGVESQGMILAASEGEVLALLSPHRDIPAGTKIK